MTRYLNFLGIYLIVLGVAVSISTVMWMSIMAGLWPLAIILGTICAGIVCLWVADELKRRETLAKFAADAVTRKATRDDLYKREKS